MDRQSCLVSRCSTPLTFSHAVCFLLCSIRYRPCMPVLYHRHIRLIQQTVCGCYYVIVRYSPIIRNTYISWSHMFLLLVVLSRRHTGFSRLKPLPPSGWLLGPEGPKPVSCLQAVWCVAAPDVQLWTMGSLSLSLFLSLSRHCVDRGCRLTRTAGKELVPQRTGRGRRHFAKQLWWDPPP